MNSPFSIASEFVKYRKKPRLPVWSAQKTCRQIWSDGIPCHISGKYMDSNIFYAIHAAVYMDRDVCKEIYGMDHLSFQDFVRAASGSTEARGYLLHNKKCRTIKLSSDHGSRSNKRVPCTHGHPFLHPQKRAAPERHLSGV